MLPLVKLSPMAPPHDTGNTLLMNHATVSTPTKLTCTFENKVWTQDRCKDLSKNNLEIEKDTICDDFKKNSKVLPMAAAFARMKACTTKEASRACINSSIQQEQIPKSFLCNNGEYGSLLPGLSDDVARYCLALVPRSDFQSLKFVSKLWRHFIQSKEYYMARKLAGTLEEWLYVLTSDSCGGKMQWQVLNCVQDKWEFLPPMPGPLKTAFGIVVLEEKLLVIGGSAEDSGPAGASADVFKYDPILNRWSSVAKMNVARCEFACAVVDGLVYVVGGHGVRGENLSSVEVFDPQQNKWTVIDSLRRPRWGCFACGLQGKLYVMGGRSSFTIGNSRYVDIYNPQDHVWDETKNGCVMVVAHTVVNQSLFCIEWKNERQLGVFDSVKNSWKNIPVPLTGSMTVGFCFGSLNGKLLLFSTKEEPMYETLVYDPNAVSGSEWQITSIKPSSTCLCSVTLTA